MPFCVQRGEKKGVKWFIKTTDQPGQTGQRIEWETAILISLEFNKEVEQIHNMFEE